MSLPPRDEIDPEYRFDLTRIYETPADWDDALDGLRERLTDLQVGAGEPLDSAEDLRSLLAETEECYRRKQRLELYAQLSRNVVTGDEEADDRQNRVRDLETDFEPAVAAVRRRVGSVDADRFESWLDDLEGYRRYAESLRDQAAHARSAEVEDAIAAFEDPRTAPKRVVRAVATEDFDPPAIEDPDGEPVEITFGNYRTELSRRDRDYRCRVYEAYRAELDRFEHTLARAYAEKLNAAAAEIAVRGYDSIRDRAFQGESYPDSGLSFRLPVEVHDAMVDAVRANLDPYHRARELRRAELGVENLRPWDLAVPVADVEPPEISYEEAREHVLASLEPLGQDYVDRVRGFFQQRRIDVYPTQDKRTDIEAYCPSSGTDGAFVLLNFREDVRTTYFLAHELGHAINVEYHREGPARYATGARPTSEVPSLVHELLLAEHFLAEGGALAEDARYRLLDRLGANFFRATKGTAFAQRTAEIVEDGRELTPERGHEVWADLQAEFEASVAYDDRARKNWLGKGYRDIFSSYQYVLGATGALAAREKLRDGDLDPAEYRDFLASTGLEDLLSLFERLGCDVTTGEPFARAAEAFDRYADEAER